MPFVIDFSGKTIIVTGGNRGIGHAISEAAAEAGANVGIIYRSSKDAPKIAEEISKKYNVKAKVCLYVLLRAPRLSNVPLYAPYRHPRVITGRAYQCDVGDADLVTKTFKEIQDDLGTVAGVVANAGIAVVKPALDITRADYDKQMGTNVYGTFAVCQAAARTFVDSQYKEGSIVIIASMSSHICNKGITQTFYNVSKGAVVNMAKQLAAEWSQYGIRVNCVSPGVTNTDQTHEQSPELRKEIIANTPLGRYAESSEMAGQTIFLLSNKSSYQTGAEYLVDGGFLIHATDSTERFVPIHRPTKKTSSS
ncbi:uncharacterized protein L969DRAFT_14229 [Mixia osmundae IAM 14324]|uniref:uncharacterized protein n=1 Tax=Mixia osmundae (strain CBS 9802 / IAM 14324 / JCM 22182 / KY 12970) TaxID=764103 RepID=UPI0004A5493F|nr:uncharacterized protein L969DRAFT_14229 [Mixia osmundae IAM 14324]KEI42025.1 hypothetical protein L969DRAFT_14229 [Mixia osmundae IAM 14324]